MLGDLAKLPGAWNQDNCLSSKLPARLRPNSPLIPRIYVIFWIILANLLTTSSGSLEYCSLVGISRFSRSANPFSSYIMWNALRLLIKFLYWPNDQKILRLASLFATLRSTWWYSTVMEHMIQDLVNYYIKKGKRPSESFIYKTLFIHQPTFKGWKVRFISCFSSWNRIHDHFDKDVRVTFSRSRQQHVS